MRESDSERISGGGAEREEARIPSRLRAVSTARWEARTHDLWGSDLSWNQELDSWPAEPPRHPRNSILRDLLPWEFHQPGRLDTDHWRGDWKSVPHTSNACHKLSNLLFILLWAHSSFLEVIYSCLSGLHPSPLHLLGWYISSKISSFWGDIHFFCPVTPQTYTIKNSRMYVPFLLPMCSLSVYFINPAVEPRRREGTSSHLYTNYSWN